MRESKTVNGTKTRYVYNKENIIGEIFDDNIYTYYRATELIGYTNNKGDRYYYRQNSHGDVTAILDIQGNEKKTYSYNAYGKENPFILNPMGNQTAILQWKAEIEKVYNPFRYAGEYYDQETRLIYLRNRYYDNSIGRFITKDPIRDGLNWYAYCGNNPVMFIDPWGLAPGDLIVNDVNINQTTIRSDGTYGSVRSFIQAIGGTIQSNGDGSYTVAVGDLVTTLENISVGKSARATVYRNIYDKGGRVKKQKKVGSFDYDKELDESNPGNALYVGNMQKMVNIYGKDYAIKLKYDLGEAGGTYLSDNIFANFQYIVVPMEMARDVYNNNKIIAFLDGASDGLSGAVAKLVASYIEDAYFKNILNSNFRFVNFCTFIGIFENDEQVTGVNELNVPGQNVGVFLYGSYLD